MSRLSGGDVRYCKVASIFTRRNVLKILGNMRSTVVVALVMSAVLFACAGKILPPPVTDSSYFNAKMDKLATDLINTSSKKVRRAAVLNFVNTNGRTSDLGRYVTTKFYGIVVSKSLFTMPTGGQVEQSITKLELDYQGTLNKETAGKLGRELGVEALIIGQIADLQKGSDVDLTVQMVEVRTGNIISAASTNFYRSKQVSSLLEKF